MAKNREQESIAIFLQRKPFFSAFIIERQAERGWNYTGGCLFVTLFNK
jgi:hypothetical protein